MILTPPPNAWVCTACGREFLAAAQEHRTPLHPCPAMKGLMTPFTRPGVAAAVRRVAREDYSMGQELQRDEDGKVAMAVVVTRDDGEDRAILAPTAVVDLRGL